MTLEKKLPLSGGTAVVKRIKNNHFAISINKLEDHIKQTVDNNFNTTDEEAGHEELRRTQHSTIEPKRMTTLILCKCGSNTESLISRPKPIRALDSEFIARAAKSKGGSPFNYMRILAPNRRRTLTSPVFPLLKRLSLRAHFRLFQRNWGKVGVGG
ncbi:hypothetical protein CDAR_51001 [Caerostris darwini]|uniref:Uncharacterized protein n=1 Tax=Caerostris darwini TaxID=1538125 RepID=A0AAV4U5V4_9ARAC|nr:hypothetical protein CDAR_51001 [Caerostris darwini]